MTRGLIILLLLVLLAQVPTACGGRDPIPIGLSNVDAVAGLSTPVRVIVDRHGIPHVYASRREDAAFALGWLHAQDRFLQMDVYRRAGLGRLAEILGSIAVDEDRQARTLGLHRIAHNTWEVLVNRTTETVETRIIRAYTAGVNHHLESAGLDDLPEFYRERGLTPEPWTEVDCFAVYKKFTAELCFSLDDILLQVVAEGLGEHAANELFLNTRETTSPMVRHPIRADEITGLRVGTTKKPGSSPRTPTASPATPSTVTRRTYSDLELECHEILQNRAHLPDRMAARNALASNAWVINGARSANGKPILCVDPHLGFSRPTLFYTAHLATPGLGVLGATVPGLPAILFGHNGFVSWAFSNSQADVTDFYVEEFDPDNPDRYYYRGHWRSVAKYEETIRVLGGEDVTFTVRNTVHGPVLNKHGRRVSAKWMGAFPSADLTAFLRMNAARNLRQFLDAQRDYMTPVLNFVYADSLGHIAVRSSGWIPRRTRGDGRFPLEGSRGEDEWRGSPVPFEEMPLSVDPPEGLLIAANQALLPANESSPHYLGWQFAPPFRAERLDEVLSSGRRFTPNDMSRLQLDASDLFFRKVIPVLLRAFPKPPQEPEVQLALRLLEGWDGRVLPLRVEPTIAWEWLEHYSEAVWSDNWADASLPRDAGWQFSNGDWKPPLDVLLALSLGQNESHWFDDLRTPELEDRDTIMRRSFSAAIKELVTEFGPGMNTWTWSTRNRMVIPDLLNDPQRALNIEAVPGNSNTVCPGGAGGAVTRGAVYRLVVPLGNFQRARGAAPGTQASIPPELNGNALFQEQLQSYLTGNYVPLYYYSYFGDFPADEIAHLYTFAPRGKALLHERFPRRSR